MPRVRVIEKIETPTPAVVHKEAATHIPTTPHQGGLFNKLNPKTLRLIGLAFVLLIFTIFLIGLINERNKLKREVSQQSSSNGSANQDVNAISAEISKFVELPGNETPVLRNVEDAAKLKEESPALIMLLADIKDGDKILFYASVRKMVVYRPTTKKVVGVINVPTSTNPTTQPTPATNNKR